MPDASFGRRSEQVDVNSISFLLTLFLQTADPRYKRRVLEQHPILLDPGLDNFMEFTIASLRGSPEMAEALNAHRVLLARCREAGMDQAFAEWAARPPATLPPPPVTEPNQEASEDLTFTASLFLQAATGAAKRQLVNQHPELLSPAADRLLAYWYGTAHSQGRDDIAQLLDAHRRLLLRCRQIGVEAAFAEQRF